MVTQLLKLNEHGLIAIAIVIRAPVAGFSSAMSDLCINIARPLTKVAEGLKIIYLLIIKQFS